MDSESRGERPRPRVAVCGKFTKADLDSLKGLFPTVWYGESFAILSSKVSVSEIDLLVIGPGIFDYGNWPESTHVICFSQAIDTLPGPVKNCRLQLYGTLPTEAFIFPQLTLPLSRRREADLIDLASVKGWNPFVIMDLGMTTEQREITKSLFFGGAILQDKHTGYPLATQYIRNESNLGIAWFPNEKFNKIAWIESIASLWAQFDSERFPSFGDWKKLPQWQSAEEEEIQNETARLEKEKTDATSRINRAIGTFMDDFVKAQRAADQGLRRLVSSQGEDLVQEVSAVLQRIGFIVEKVDDQLESGQARREDLRLRLPETDEQDWEAIVEVRGYTKSAGKTADMTRLNRFAELYNIEKGRHPSKRMYIVNGQIELPPQQRQEPLASAEEDLSVFAESDGVLISTLDLFRLAKRVNSLDKKKIRDSIRNAQGRFTV
jgi:hypothetical protein